MKKIILICLYLLIYCLFAQTEPGVVGKRNKDLLNILSTMKSSSSNLDREITEKSSNGRLTIPLETTPYWSSQAISGSIMGTHLVDITGDGYPEVITLYESSGGGYIYLYLNNLGFVDTTPSWQANDNSDNIWASFGDYDNDGDLDMAAAGLLLFGSTVRLYQNNDGTLTTDPVWIASAVGGVCCDWGDVDNDGDLDLATADLFFKPSVFYNNNGTLEIYPSWQGIDYMDGFGVAWFDVDNDGDLDLAVGGLSGQPSLRIYYNNNGALEPVSSWRSQLSANSYSGYGLSIGDLDKDGWLDIGVSSGFINPVVNFIFKNLRDSLESNPSWYSDDAAPSGGCLFGDLNGDNYLDWAVNNGNFGACYENIGGSLNTSYTWQSSTAGGLGIDLGDVDQDGVRYKEDTLITNGTKKLFYLSILPIHKLEEITINGNPMPVSDYCYNLKSGWVSFRDSIPAGSQVIFKYNHSIDMELLLCDYPNDQAHLFKNNNIGIIEKTSQPLVTNLRVYPTVSNGNIEFSYTLSEPGHVKAEVYDCKGCKVSRLFERENTLCFHKEKISTALPAGIYFLRLEINQKFFVKKFVVVKGDVK